MFNVGDYVIYDNGNTIQIGRVKAVYEQNRNAFVCYHSGETAALTSFDYLRKISNQWNIEKTDLGGDIWGDTAK